MISAPQGAGKTHNAEALRVMFGCSSVVDGWDGIRAVPPGALVLTSVPLISVPAIRDVSQLETRAA